LGVQIPAEYKETVIKSLAGMAELKKRRKAARLSPTADPDQDEYFAYIAGYTDGGVPYGITWEEAEQDQAKDIKRGQDATS